MTDPKPPNRSKSFSDVLKKIISSDSPELQNEKPPITYADTVESTKAARDTALNLPRK